MSLWSAISSMFSRRRRPGPDDPPSPPAPPPTSLDYATVYFSEALARYPTSPLMLANVQSGLPNGMALAALPGTSAVAKANYLLDYLEEGGRTGLSAYDMISRTHDTMLRKAKSSPQGARASARLSFGGASGTLFAVIQAGLTRDGIHTIADFAKMPVYGGFWAKYGLVI